MIVTALLVAVGLGLVLIIVAESSPHSPAAHWLHLIFSPRIKSIGDLEKFRRLSVDELALVEKYVPRLRSVVIICHRVDEPNVSLAKAVIDNFQQGAVYSFFVSPDSTHDGSLAEYQEWFSHLFYVAKGGAPLSGDNSVIRQRDFDSVFAIKRLPSIWNNVPYVFYSFATTAGDLATLCFRGTQPGVGISAYYDRVSGIEARAIIDLASSASAAFTPAIGGATTELDAPIPDTKVVDFQKRVGSRS